MDREQLIVQLKVTIEAIEEKLAESPEKVVSEYLVKYESALHEPDNQKLLNKLLNCVRGYMETSSCYDQNFLNEMGKSEQLIRAIKSL
ncbi:hypothetical protein OA92_07215 [Marinomonas sp. SBI22]|uniref:hypothetical protein n=1 Tax=unclassified Marinomonas TaxID=196814 RepID=UPI0007AF284A|nr:MULTISPECIES: hypothetical protein [unclassified Marinomonas]KZM40410.1 hypothetical protein OA91_19415 [Marinomonas sp. SBI8L]KZM43501.1 hypothetical protein OA92_07215 [Marinomonas sp. SBI22]